MNPADLLQLSGGYWATCALHAGVKLDIFTQLASGDLTAAEVAQRCNCDVRAMTMLLNALAAMDLLHKSEDRYNSTNSAMFLSRTSENYLGHIIMHHHHLMQSWSRLPEAIMQGEPVRQKSSHNEDPAALESFLLGMYDLASLNAPKIVPNINLAGRSRLLDLGGGPGTYAIHFCLANTSLTAVIFDLPTTQPFADQTVKRFGLEQRITFKAGDVSNTDIGSGYDVIWISHLLHSEGPEATQAILGKAVQALEPGGILLIQEFILDDTHDAPLFPALFSLNMLLGTENGQAYSECELSAMMAYAGLSCVSRLEIDSPNGSGIMIGTK